MKRPALTQYRCTATSWKGEGPSPLRNRCIQNAETAHEYHTDENGNHFRDDGSLRLIINDAHLPTDWKQS